MQAPSTQFDAIAKQIADLLKVAQREFNKNPSSASWNNVLNLMLAHQQMTQITYSYHGEVRRDAVVNATRTTPNHELPHVVVQTILGQTINEVLGR